MKRNLSILLCCCLPGLAWAGEGRTELSQSDMPITLSSGGSYVLTENLQGSSGVDGITLSADDVILDLNGFTLRGAANASGIIAPAGQINIVIRNGIVSDWGESGLQLGSVTNIMLENIIASGCGDDGMEVGANAVLFQCQALENGENGITAGHVSALEDCVSRSNTLAGISVGDFSAISSTTSRDNGQQGIQVGSYCTLNRVATRANGSNGVEAVTGCVVADSIAHNNLGHGFQLLSEGHKIERSSAYGNNLYGVHFSTMSMVEGVVSRVNSNGGFYGLGQSFLLQNTAEQNAGPGFLIDGNENRIEQNHSVTNITGFDVNGSDNLIIQNTAFGNGTAYSISAGNYSLIRTNPGTTAANFDNPWASYEY